jgi:predicted component of type VI protein secretion system
MQIKLKVLEGNQAGSEVVVRGPKFIVGRDADCHLRPRSDLISRHHCVLIVEQGYAGVRDFNSKNGTFVNGEKVTGECQLKTGDELMIGPLRFSVQLDHSLGGPKRSKVTDVKGAVARTSEIADGGDLDISDWLAEEDTTSDDTREKISAPGSDIDAETTRVENAADETVKEAKPEAPNVFSQEAIDDSNKPKDTRSAAADVLRKLREQKLQKGKK